MTVAASTSGNLRPASDPAAAVATALGPEATARPTVGHMTAWDETRVTAPVLSSLLLLAEERASRDDTPYGSRGRARVRPRGPARVRPPPSPAERLRGRLRRAAGRATRWHSES